MADLTVLKGFRLHLDARIARFRLPYTGEPGEELPPQIRDWLIGTLLHVRDKKRGLVRLIPNRAQREYSKKCTKRNIVLKARQLGITTYLAARFFVQTITQPGTLTVQVAHSQESAEELFRTVHRFLENLPGGGGGALVQARSNVRQISFRKLDSEFRIEAADENAGRGLTIHHLHCSEVARWSRGGMEALASLRAAVPASGEIALESTPNGAGGVFYEEWQRADETGYTRHFFPWWYADDYKLKFEKLALSALSDEEKDLVQRAGLTKGQIAFRRLKWAQMRGMASQEFAEDPVSCFRASGESVFDMEAIERAYHGCGEPLEMRDNRRLRIWFPAQKGKQYIVGVDPAGGGSDGDYSCAQVIDRETGMHCAELHGHFPPREMALKLVELAKTYNDALVAVERNNHGYGVLATVRGQGYLNVYKEGNQDGWLTTAVSRPAMIENLAEVLVAAPMLFHSPLLLNECRTFVRQADGNTGAALGAHDDSVMAMAIAYAVRRAVAGNVQRRGLEVASLRVEE
jgi:hypothetical protein